VIMLLEKRAGVDLATGEALAEAVRIYDFTDFSCSGAVSASVLAGGHQCRLCRALAVRAGRQSISCERNLRSSFKNRLAAVGFWSKTAVFGVLGHFSAKNYSNSGLN